MPSSLHAIEPRHLIGTETLKALAGVLSDLANRRNDPLAEVSKGLRTELRSVLRGRTIADTHALAQLCTTTLDAMAARAEIDDRGRYVIQPTNAELADEREGIQVISEFNTLRAYLTRVAKGEASHHPFGALVRHHHAAIDLIGSLRASMDNLGFYAPADDDHQVSGSDAVDMLNALAARITEVLNDGLTHANAPSPDTPSDALRALAELVDQLRAIGIADGHGAEGLDLARAEQVLRTGGYEVAADRVPLAQPLAPGLDPRTFETQRTWVLSSDHIPQDLYKHLQREACDTGSYCYADFVAVASSPYLVQIAVHGNEDGEGAATPHESLAYLIKLARTHGFSHVVLDRDGPLVPGLPYVGHGVPETCLETKASAPGMGG